MIFIFQIVLTFIKYLKIKIYYKNKITSTLKPFGPNLSFIFSIIIPLTERASTT